MSRPGRGREMRADFLLNFQRPAGGQQRSAPQGGQQRYRGGQGSRRVAAPVAFAKGRFVQSSFRLFVSSMTQDVVEAALSADALLQWSSVCLVDLLCEEQPKCPICLEEAMVVPKITRCGHVYCAPCIMRYHMTLGAYNGKPAQRCPVCNDMTSPEDLTSVRIQLVSPLREGDRVSFVLAERAAESTFVRLSPRLPQCDNENEEVTDGARRTARDDADELEVQSGIRLPRERDRGWHLGRLLRLAPGQAVDLLTEEIDALREYRPFAITSGDTELLPSIDAAVELLQQRRRERGEDGGSSATRVEGQSTSTRGPLLGWCCRYVDEPMDMAALGGGRGTSGSRDSRTAGADVQSKMPGEAVSCMSSPASAQIASRSRGGSECAEGGDSAEACGTMEELHLPPSEVPATRAATALSGVDGDEVEAEPVASNAPSAGKPAGGGVRVFSHYQLADGRLVFLQSFHTKLLLHEHGGRWDKLPPALVGIRLEGVQEMSIADDVRKRHKFLSHLPLGSRVVLVEVDLRNHLSKETKEYFADEFAKRRLQKKKEQNRERKEERLSKNRAAIEEEKYYKSLNLIHPAVAQQAPTKDDFAVDLHGRTVESVAAPGTEGVDGTTSIGEGNHAEAEDAEETAGPTMAEKIRERMAGKGRGRGSGGGARANGKKAAPNLAEANAFPELGGGSAAGSGGPAWGRGKAAARSPVASAKVEAPAVEERHVPDSWEDDDADAPGPASEPSFGEALEVALRRSPAMAPAAPPAQEADGAAASAADPDASAAASEGGKKKKGRAGKAQTIRLFG
eukprot:TRINITY_DN18979_c0_g1_i1.p1 TRINITY_DN18979_c0_g1~~TRINITY_DN18979_c0_g1_i1.p1  ORF type:complete len:795 (-),score=155.24 TRINITY_DN18979_c0_g1_i1:58-2442(-)